jgi:hypothetical protein
MLSHRRPLLINSSERIIPTLLVDHPPVDRHDVTSPASI